MERRSLKRLLPSLLETCVKSGPLAPRALPRFLATMSRSDSRPMPTCGYGFPHAVVRLPTRAAGSPRTLDSSVVTRPPQSPRAARCVQILVTSAPVAGFSTFGRVAAATGFTRPNQVRLRWARDFAHHDRPWSCARLPSPGRTGPFRAVSYPSTPDRSYMVNEQLTWLTPRSQLDKSGLPWCTEANGGNGKAGNFVLHEKIRASVLFVGFVAVWRSVASIASALQLQFQLSCLRCLSAAPTLSAARGPPHPSRP
jgi:hypothetical protein